MPRIFISSPYTHGNPGDNVTVQIEAFHHLRDKGWVPFAPLLSHYLHIHRVRTYEDWIDWDLEWLNCCDAYLRLPSNLPSKGADIEEQHATEIGLKRYYSLESVPCLLRAS